MFCVCDDGDGDDDENGGGNDHIGRSILGDKNYSDMAVNTIRCVQVLFQIILLVWLCQVLHKCVFSANSFVKLVHIFSFRNYIYFEFNRTSQYPENIRSGEVKRTTLSIPLVSNR